MSAEQWPRRNTYYCGIWWNGRNYDCARSYHRISTNFQVRQDHSSDSEVSEIVHRNIAREENTRG